jgi:membrane protein YqaA with SNARE-associated domain
MSNFEELINNLGIYFATFFVCFVSGFFPIVHAETYLIAVSVILKKSDVVPVIIISTFAQMLTFSLLFCAGRGIIKLPIKKYYEKINKIRDKLEKWKSATFVFIFISAFTGFPPFTILSILLGSTKLKFSMFYVFGFLGRIIRFSILILFPQVIKSYIF